MRHRRGRRLDECRRQGLLDGLVDEELLRLEPHEHEDGDADHPQRTGGGDDPVPHQEAEEATHDSQCAARPGPLQISTLIAVAATDESDLVARLQAGDEDAFATLVRQHHSSLIRVASAYVPNRAVAEEVVQDTWVGVIRGIDRFEGRSSLKTWLFHIVLNRARSTGVREHRETPADPAGATV